jgi:hypothetical protein
MSLEQIATLLSGLTVLSVASPLINARAAAPTVTLADGLVVGTTTGVYNQPAVTGLVDAYLGIPYASPPDRFEAPVAATAFRTSFLAQKYGAACIQQVNASGMSIFLLRVSLGSRLMIRQSLAPSRKIVCSPTSTYLPTPRHQAKRQSCSGFTV